MDNRRHYPKYLKINGREFFEVVIDPHYEDKHGDITDELILELVEYLDGGRFDPVGRNGDWSFYNFEKVLHRGGLYRLIWCTNDDLLYVGVINCHRRD